MMNHCEKNPQRQTVLLWALCILPIVYVAATFFRYPIQFVALVSEDNIGETATAIFCIGAGWIALREAYRSRKAGHGWIWIALFGLGALFIGLEEVSWFTRYIPYEIAWLQEKNIQKEVNLHNLGGGVNDFTETFGFIPIFLYGCLLPLVKATSKNRVGAWLDRSNFPVPPVQAIPLFLFATILVFSWSVLIPRDFVTTKAGEHSAIIVKVARMIMVACRLELVELFLGIGLLVTAGCIHAWPESRGGAGRGTACWLWCLFVSLALVQLGPRLGLEAQTERRYTEFADRYYPAVGMRKAALKLMEFQDKKIRRTSIYGSTRSATYVRMAATNRELGREKRVPKNLRKATQCFWADMADCWINLALIARLSGDDKTANRYLDEAERLVNEQLAIAPDNETLHWSMVKILACRGRRDEARKYLDNTSQEKNYKYNFMRAFIGKQKSGISNAQSDG